MLRPMSLLLICASAAPFNSALADDEKTLELLNNTYQQTASANCNYNGACAVLFPATTQVRTAITNVSCIYSVKAGVTVGNVYLTDQQYSGYFFLQPLYTGYSGTSSRYVINSVVNLYVEQGVQPRLDVSASGGPLGSLTCTVSGYHS